MADFRPFRGIRYDTAVAGQLDRLVCPPYDVISPEYERALWGRSAHNMVHLELAEITGEVGPGRYTDAAQHYARWLSEGVLRRDDQPGYYLLRQRFSHGGGTFERHNLIGALRLEEWGNAVLPHEDTRSGPKADRLALMEACAANFSPIMGLVRDEGHLLETVRNRAMASAPDAQFIGDDGQQYTLWRIADERSTTAIGEAVAVQPVYIADGHHRYETAMEYLARHRQDPAAELVLMSLTDLDDPGLLVLPYHRVLAGLPPMLFTQIRDRLAQLFVTQPVALDVSTAGPLEELVAQEGAAHPALGLLGPSGEGPFLLTLGNPDLVSRYAPQGVAAATQEVEAWVLQEVVLRPILGDAFADYVTYVHDGDQALAMVRGGQAQMAFFLKALPLDLFERLVGAGVRLPSKSTFFHPKLPSGVVINPLDNAH